jgi:hypothetical protein
MLEQYCFLAQIKRDFFSAVASQPAEWRAELTFAGSAPKYLLTVCEFILLPGDRKGRRE